MRSRNRRGFFAADTLFGLLIILSLMGTLSVAVTRQQRAMKQLAEQRESIRLAEQTMIALQTSKPPPTAPAGVNVTIMPLDTPPINDESKWVRVVVTRGVKASELIGVAPGKNLK